MVLSYSDDPVVTSLVKQKEFDELLHWHSHRLLSDDYDRTKCQFDGESCDWWKKCLKINFTCWLWFYNEKLSVWATNYISWVIIVYNMFRCILLKMIMKSPTVQWQSHVHRPVDVSGESAHLWCLSHKS